VVLPVGSSSIGIEQDSLGAIGFADEQDTELLTGLPLREEHSC
jgi:hypothetical protein